MSPSQLASELLYLAPSEVAPRGAARSSADDPRLGDRVVSLPAQPAPGAVRAIVLGVPDDRGVVLNHGRRGADRGPSAFRQRLFALPAPPRLGPGSVLDAGDVAPAVRTGDTHARLAASLAVLRAHYPGARFVIIGGGHDHAFGELVGLARYMAHRDPAARIGVMNLDAHADVRPFSGEPHSGTPFRRLLETSEARLAGPSLIAFGLQRASNAEAHVRYLAARAVAVYWLDALPDGGRAQGAIAARLLADLAERHAAVALSVDLDGFSQAVSPGVSAPSPVGLEPAAALVAAAALARVHVPTQLGLYELCPPRDRDGASARLAARLAWSFLS